MTVLDFSDWMTEILQSFGLVGTAILSGVWGGFSNEFSSFLKGIETRKTPGSKDSQEQSDNIIAAIETSSTEITQNVIHNDDFNEFIRKMIQIKEILRVSGNEDAVNLPNIVVIGSQSSGKSSVLESIIGHEFLPKGQNMVTKRPLELTLVHSPQEAEDSVIIAQYDRNLKLKDFSKVQGILKDLNSAVPEGDWISFEPIRVTIYSKKVPDLTLVDLPGYIQVTTKTQPPILRDKIRTLCDKYIKSNNFILAVCAADVDLANSEALKVCRKYDPKGERTIGVITKLDLVDASYAASLVSNEDYPLNLGYIGVVCKGPDVSGENVAEPQSILSRITGRHSKDEDPKLVYERQYFAQNQEAYSTIKDRLGLMALRHLLTASLEDIMSKSLGAVVAKVSDDLDELKYQLKAQYNDRFVSPEAYVSDLISSLKGDFAHLSRQFTRNQIDATLRGTFNQKLIQICDENIWINAGNDDKNEDKRLNSCLNSFTRSGVGRLTASLVSDAILKEIEKIMNKPPFTFHPSLSTKIFDAAEMFLKKKCQAAMEQVENSMKPYKQGIEFTPRDWKDARNRLIGLLEAEENRLKKEIEGTKQEIGVKRLKRAVEHLQNNEDQSNNPILMKTREIVYKSALLKRLQSRKMFIKKESKGELESVVDYRHRTALWTRITSIFGTNSMNTVDQSGTVRVLIYEPPSSTSDDLTIFKDPCQAQFPEIYLFLVMDRFLRTCSTFVHYELVSEFLQPFPDDVISADPVALEGQGGILSLTKMSADQLKTLLRENPEIAAHLNIQEKYRALEEALRNLKQMKRIKKEE